jgi:hypothetical protein
MSELLRGLVHGSIDGEEETDPCHEKAEQDVFEDGFGASGHVEVVCLRSWNLASG